MNHSCVVTEAQPQALAQIPERDGSTYNHARDGIRLHKQHNRVFSLMRDGKWRTLAEIAVHTRDPEASVSARLRDLRKPRFGAHTIERRRVSDGLHEYRLLVSAAQMELVA